MGSKDIRVFVFGVHDPMLLDKPHMWTTLKDCEVETPDNLESALKLHLSYLPKDHALEVLEGDSDWIPVTPGWRPGPQPIIYTRLVPLQQTGGGAGPSAMMVASQLAMLQQLHQQLHQQMGNGGPDGPGGRSAPADATPGTSQAPWPKAPNSSSGALNVSGGEGRRAMVAGPSNGGKDPQFSHQVWQGVVSLTGKYLDDGSQPEYELFEGVVEAQTPQGVTWPRRLLIGKLTSAVPMLMKLFENLSGRVGPLVQPFHMRITKRMPVLNGLMQSMRERNTVGIIQLEQHLMLLFAKGQDSFSVLLMPRSFGNSNNSNAANPMPTSLGPAAPLPMLPGPSAPNGPNGPGGPPSSGAGPGASHLPPIANLIAQLGMPPIPGTAMGAMGGPPLGPPGLHNQMSNGLNGLLPASMAMGMVGLQPQPPQQQPQQAAPQPPQQQPPQQQQPQPMQTNVPQQMPSAMTQ